MNWSFILDDIRSRLSTALLAAGLNEVDVYLGARADIVEESRIYLIRGTANETPSAGCTSVEQIIYIELWAYRAIDGDVGSDDLSEQNTRRKSAYDDLIEIREVVDGEIKKADGYRVKVQAVEPDGDYFYPAAGERLTLECQFMK